MDDKVVLVLPVSNLDALEELKDVITNSRMLIKVVTDEEFELFFKQK